jgi:hypothetical protein
VAPTAADDAIAITVEGLVKAQPAVKYQSAPVTLKMSHDTINNSAIYYWASSQGSLLSQTFGQTNAPSKVKADCTACHSLSRAGTRIGYSRCVGGDCNNLYAGFMRLKDNVWTETMDANAKAFKGSYTTFAPVGNPFPDDTKAVALLARDSCNLSLFDPDAGMPIASNVEAVSTHDGSSPARCATMPDWSPDGKTVVFASTPHAGQWIDLSDSAIATMSYSYSGGTHTFGEPQFIVRQAITLPSGAYNNFFFPSFSPDGAFIVFNAARSAWRNGSDENVPGQRLMLTNPTGSFAIELGNLNGPGDSDITWPHWAPGTAGAYRWIVFSSERPYGHKLTPANTDPSCVSQGVKQCKQIWIGAIDNNKLSVSGTPMDPSAPPVWLPGQSIAADNISPYWTVPATVQ